MFRTGLRIVHTQLLKDLLLAIFLSAIFAIIAVTCFTGCVSAPPIKLSPTGKELKNTDTLQMVYKNELVGSLTVAEFKALLDASKNYSNLLRAESTERIKIELETSPWVIKTTDNTFETFANIIWYNDKAEQIKKVRFRIRLNKNNSSWTVSKIDEFYTKASRVMFPTMSGISLVLIILLIILL